MCPTIYPGDGAELTAAAWSLGVPHPTGYPLFMVLGHLFQRLGLGSPAFSMNLLTALFGAAAAAGVYRLQREIWRAVCGTRAARLPAMRFAAAALALALGASAAWWGQSVQTEVYTLALAFIAFAWSAGLRLIRHPGRRGLWSLAALSGFALLHHMLFIVTFPLSALAALNWWLKSRGKAGPPSPAQASFPPAARGSRRPRWLALALALALFALPLLGYLYLPLRAAALPPVNWGNPRGLSGILWHLSGSQYSSTRILAGPGGEKLAARELPEHAERRLRELGRWLSGQFAPLDPDRPHRGPVLVLVILLLAALGLFLLWRRSPLGALGLLGGMLLNLLLVLLYTIADIEAYQTPLLILLGCLAMTGPVAAARLFPRPTGGRAAIDRQWSRRGAAAGAFALALAVFSVFNWSPPERGVNKALATEAYDYADALTRLLPPNSVVFTFSDFDIFPLWYLQVCENRRPDIAVMGANFALNGWYAAQLRSTLPAGVSAYIGDEPPPKHKQRWLDAFLGGMAAPALQTGRPVYLTFYDPSIEQYFSLDRRFSVPAPASARLMSDLARAGSDAADSPREAPPSPPLPVFELGDPAGYGPQAIRRYLQEFPPEERRLAVGKKGR